MQCSSEYRAFITLTVLSGVVCVALSTTALYSVFVCVCSISPVYCDASAGEVCGPAHQLVCPHEPTQAQGNFLFKCNCCLCMCSLCASLCMWVTHICGCVGVCVGEREDCACMCV